MKGEIGSKEGRDVITNERTLLGSLNLRRRKMDRLRVDNSPAPMIPLTIGNTFAIPMTTGDVLWIMDNSTLTFNKESVFSAKWLVNDHTNDTVSDFQIY